MDVRKEEVLSCFCPASWSLLPSVLLASVFRRLLTIYTVAGDDRCHAKLEMNQASLCATLYRRHMCLDNKHFFSEFILLCSSYGMHLHITFCCCPTHPCIAEMGRALYLPFMQVHSAVLCRPKSCRQLMARTGGVCAELRWM